MIVSTYQAELALTSDGFTDIDFATLSSIIKRETLNCKETVVFAAAQAWGRFSSKVIIIIVCVCGGSVGVLCCPMEMKVPGLIPSIDIFFQISH